MDNKIRDCFSRIDNQFLIISKFLKWEQVQ